MKTLTSFCVKLFILFLLLAAPCLLYAQRAPEILWQRCLGGSQEELSGLGNRSIVETNDGGYIICGSTESNDGDVSGHHGDSVTNYDIWVVKINASGGLQWQKCLGGSLNENANSIIQTADNGYAIAGWTGSNDGDVSGNFGPANFGVIRHAWIVKLDSLGSLKWQRCVGGNGQDIATSIIQTSDGGYTIAGYTSSNNEGFINHGADDVWLIKLDSLGYLQRQKCFGGKDGDQAWCIIHTIDGGYAIASDSYSNEGDVSGNHGLGDAWIVKIDSLWNIQWQKCLGGTKFDGATSIIQTNDHGYAIAVNSQSDDGDVSRNHSFLDFGDYWIVKVDSTGNIIWEKCFGGLDNERPQSIIQTKEGGYAIVGITNSTDGDVKGKHGKSTGGGGEDSTDFWIMKLQSTGLIEWQKCLGGFKNDVGYTIIQTKDENYAIVGNTYSNDGDVSGNHGGSDLWVVKFKAPVNSVEDSQTQNNFSSIYPNPSTDQIRLQLSETQTIRQIQFYDVMGRELKPEYHLAGSEATADVRNFPDGAYIARVVYLDKDIIRSSEVPFVVEH